MTISSEVQASVSCLAQGGIVLLPTDTVYGLAVNPNIEKSVDRLYQLKKRPKKLPLPIMVANQNQLSALGLEINQYAVSLLNSEYMPGAVTLVMGFQTKPLVNWLEGREECGIRLPNDERLLQILTLTGPLLVTSANIHGAPAIPQSPSEILSQLNGKPDLVIEGGKPKSIPSTIVNCRIAPPIIERQGFVSAEQINECLKAKKIVS